MRPRALALVPLLGALTGGAAAEPAAPAGPAMTAIRCTRAGLSVSAPAPFVARWDRRNVEAGVGAVEVRWCGPGEATLLRMAAGPVTRWRAADAPPVRLRAGQAATFTLAGTAAPSEVTLTVTARSERGPLVARTTLVSVDAPLRIEARRACDACRGTWGRFGVAQLEVCNCATTDAGTRCASDRDCQGYCDGITWEPIAGTCPAGQRRERAVGRCSSRASAFTCVALLDEPMTRCAAPEPPDWPRK